ncbi:VWA domain-containing protein [Parahaliea sp. F7430]|uniref:VWA domain-containing protein n=1 Tax=Sediminihaliea albiluteola TaxID=2758564 RepID=A0A7W2TTK1_9GAMM|nr:vWA domain-containing protein [Sediminihaliea albiluteola]MBA6411661.1 VWA domain-containing protein [Sediminihaliea albiluteola]
MGRKKRGFTTFNLSFLDIMSCGFGAVVLVFLIIDHSIEVQTRELNRDLLSEIELLEEDIKDGEAGLVRLRNTLSEVDLRMVEAQGRASRISEEIEQYEAQIAALKADGFSERDSIEQLKADIQELEAKVKELRKTKQQDSGQSARSFLGDGNRQYLTGLNLGGKNILILVDVSASMLADRLVNIIRLRNMDPAVQRRAEKWGRTLNTVDWLTSQLPINSHYQVLSFNTEAKVVLPGTEGQWLEVSNRAQLEQLSRTLHQLSPSGGTSLENAFAAIAQLSPRPDNIILITDGLPTQGKTRPRGNTVSGAERLKLYRRAVTLLPRNVPVSVILAPMEGDPMAASELWKLAISTKGAFISPSRDWP